MWGVMWGALTILKIPMPDLLGILRETDSASPACTVLAQRSDRSRHPDFQLITRRAPGRLLGSPMCCQTRTTAADRPVSVTVR
jgi:hypothetical protein